MIPYNPNTKKNAQELRKNMTPEEKNLWYNFLKRLPITVKRQHRIEDYIVDFYIAERKVVIELDGRQHLMEENKNADETRDKKLTDWGISVVRIPNKSINKDFNKVCNWLLQELGIESSELK
jgi:very-short-patch-repair endonuclease